MENQKQIEFIKLYEPLHNQFSRFCRFISGNTDDAEDLMNDAILNVLEGFDKIMDKAAFKSYVFSVASNLHKMKIRRMKFKAEFNSKEINQIVDFAANPENAAEFRIIYEKILLLPEKMAETIILYYISDLSIEEIRKIQGGSLSGVKQRLKRGREQVFALLNTPQQVKMAILFFAI